MIDNSDPAGLGRVKVAFYWAGGNRKSDWMHLIQPHAGAGKGFYFIPEIDEEVLVGFEGGSAEKPYVMGTNYNGSESSGYGSSGNDIKVIQTRSGCKILINDADGSILTEDKAGSKVFQDGKGNITGDAPETITFNCKNMVVNASESIITTAGMNISESAGVDKSTTVGAILNTSVGGDSMMNVVGDMFELVKGNKETEGKEIKEMAKEVTLNSIEGNINVKGAKNVNNHSGEKSKNA